MQQFIVRNLLRTVTVALANKILYISAST